MPSGQPTDAKTLTAARRWWKENGRNGKKTARKFCLHPNTISAAVKREGWIEWADAVDEAKLKQPIAIQSQAQREAQILRIHDSRLGKLETAIPDLAVEPRGAIGEVSTITKDSRLINGGDTERIGFSDALVRLLGEFRKLSPEERAAEIAKAEEAERDVG